MIDTRPRLMVGPLATKTRPSSCNLDGNVNLTQKNTRSSTWLVYERCVAAFAHEQYGDLSTIVQPNVLIKGAISGIDRQIDVMVDSRWNNEPYKRLIIDAKARKRRINVNDVESFEGLMKDCNASHGVIICTNGWTDGATKRAQDAITINLLSFEDALKYEWVWEPCLGDCNKNRNHLSRGMVLWTEFQLFGRGPAWLMLQTGKCDGCHSFHVWCWDCGEKFAVPDNDVVQCACGLYWASVPESKDSGHVGEPESVWLMMREDMDATHILPTVIDRRPIR